MNPLILPFDQLKGNATNDIQDNFTSACAYFDIKRIATLMKEKIIPNIQHFYILMTAYIGVKQRISDAREKFRRDNYIYYAASASTVGNRRSYSQTNVVMSYKDFYFKYMVKELLDIIKLFVANGFVLTLPTYNILAFLDIDLSPIDHLFSVLPKEKIEIKSKYQNVYKNYIDEVSKLKSKSHKNVIVKSQASFEKICESCTLGEIIEAKIKWEKLVFTQNCIKSSLSNAHTEVFEFFCSIGYVPSLEDLIILSKLDRRFILITRFYPNVINTANVNNFKELDKKINESDVFRLHWKVNKSAVENTEDKYFLCDMYDPNANVKNLINVIKFDDEYADLEYSSEEDFDNEVLVKRR